MTDDDNGFATCVACGREHEPHATKLCPRCRNTLGVHEMKPSRRPAAACVKCAGWAFVRVVPRVIVTSHESGDVFAPMPLTFAFEMQDALMLRANVRAPAPNTRRGTAEAFVCQTCGFIEWYCQNPARIPIGPEYMTELIDDTPESSPPYR